jgi:5-methylcytosine-specific restriction endonuclease McrA
MSEWAYLNKARSANLRGAKRAIAHGCRFEDAYEHILTLLKTRHECYYCGRPLKLKQKTIDHVIPIIQGGGHLGRNLVVACDECNQEKNCMGLLQYLLAYEQREAEKYLK